MAAAKRAECRSGNSFLPSGSAAHRPKSSASAIRSTRWLKPTFNQVEPWACIRRIVNPGRVASPEKVRIYHIPIRDGAGFRNRQPACVHRIGGGNATGWLGSPRRRDVAGRAPAHREYPRNENQCRRSGRYPPPAGRPLGLAGTAVRSLGRCPYPADTAGQVARRAIVGRDHNADAPPAWCRVRTSPEHPPPPGYRRTRAEILPLCDGDPATMPGKCLTGLRKF